MSVEGDGGISLEELYAIIDEEFGPGTAAAYEAAAPPSSVTNSRRLMLDMGGIPASHPVCRTLSLPQSWRN